MGCCVRQLHGLMYVYLQAVVALQVTVTVLQLHTLAALACIYAHVSEMNMLINAEHKIVCIDCVRNVTSMLCFFHSCCLLSELPAYQRG